MKGIRQWIMKNTIRKNMIQNFIKAGLMSALNYVDKIIKLYIVKLIKSLYNVHDLKVVKNEKY